jgi:hypothetical protein
MMVEKADTPNLLPHICLLCGAPYPTADWRCKRSVYGVIYLCDDCCQRLGPRKADLMARHFLAMLTIVLRAAQISGEGARARARAR